MGYGRLWGNNDIGLVLFVSSWLSKRLIFGKLEVVILIFIYSAVSSSEAAFSSSGSAELLASRFRPSIDEIESVTLFLNRRGVSMV